MLWILVLASILLQMTALLRIADLSFAGSLMNGQIIRIVTTHKKTKNKHIQTHRLTDSQTHRQTHRHTDRLTHSQTHTLANSQTHRHTDRLTHAHTHTLTNSHTRTLTNSQTHTLTHSHTHTLANSQTRRRTDSHTSQDQISLGLPTTQRPMVSTYTRCRAKHGVARGRDKVRQEPTHDPVALQEGRMKTGRLPHPC